MRCHWTLLTGSILQARQKQPGLSFPNFKIVEGQSERILLYCNALGLKSRSLSENAGKTKMRLMISVVSVSEARDAILGGADLLDVKNPAEGSLGAQTPLIIRGIKETCPPGIQLSAAIGDMPNLPGTAALAALGAAVCGVDYIKAGLYGIRSETDAVILLRKMQEAVS